ncbi:restriction endonuclease subunit S [Viridibacillus arvi]|uniref:restriction endonuclease subunit S n=1 Tax=Viridibacillus arvi TaxID=263475 RepID=UPI003D06690D
MSRYGDFEIGKLFDIDRGDIKDQRALIDDKNGISFVAQNDTDNGFVKRVEYHGYKKFMGGNIIIGRQTGVVYYQPDEFVTTDGLLVLKSKFGGYSKNVGLFLVSAIKLQMKKFGYSNTVSKEKLTPLKLSLPIKENGKPDWEYMDHFISKLEQKLIDSKVSSVVSAYKADIDETILNQDIRWNVISINKLFSISPTKNYGLSNDKLINSKGKTPVVTNISYNNGISFYIDRQPTEKKGVITFSDTANMSTKTIFYQPEDFIGYSHVQAMRPLFKGGTMTENEGLFIVTAIRKQIAGQYDYYRKLNRRILSNTKINMPVDSDGEIDWRFINNYIENIKRKVTLSTRNLIN